MLDIREIEYWISRYEQEADKLDHCVTLAALYTCRKELSEGEPIQKASSAREPRAFPEESLGRYGDSEFLRLVEGLEPTAAWAVMDELMETLRVVYPRVFESVMRKLEGL